MVAVGIADYRVQDNVLCDALSCIVAVYSYEFADAVQSSPDVAQGVAGLMESHFGVKASMRNRQ